MPTDIRFKRGLQSDLPTSAPSGTPLWCEDSGTLYIGTGETVKKVGSHADTSTIALQDANGNEITTTYEPIIKGINILPSTGTIELQDNSINRIEQATGKITFVLPDVDDTNFHQILVQIYSMLAIIDLGTSNYFNPDAEIPSTAIGHVDLIYEYDGEKWSVGILKKGEISK